MLTHIPQPNKTLELTVLSAENLHVNQKLNTKNLYVVVRAESINSYTTQTAEERGGGRDNKSNPSWNEKLLVDIPVHARCITLEVKCKTSKGVKDVVGVARIAISDILGGVVHDYCLQFLSYRLRDWEGRRNGVINFSVKVVKSSEIIPVKMEKEGSCRFVNMKRHVGEEEMSGSSGGVVVGIPVMWNNFTSSSSSSSNVWNLKNEYN